MLFTRESLTLDNLLFSLTNGYQGWCSLLLCILLIGGSFILTKSLRKNPWVEVHTKNYDQDQHFWIHSAWRLAWPTSLLILIIITHQIWVLFYSQSVWFAFMGVTTFWLILIRFIMAILRFALPKLFEKSAEYFLSFLLWLSFVFWLSGLDEAILETLNLITFNIGKTRISLLGILTAILWVSITLVIALWIGRLLEIRIMSLKRIDLNVRIVINKVMRIGLVVLALLITLPLVGIDLTVLSILGGAVGVGVGFGLQKIASSYISGFIILLDRSIRMGDRLIVNDKTTGYVTKITSRYVVLKNFDGSEALVPNESLITNTVINQSYSDKRMWQQINLQVAYDTDLTKALAILQAAATHPRIETSPGPSATVVNFGDSGIDLSIGFWVSDPENGFLILRSSVLLSIWSQFKQHKIEFPFPQREIRILNNPVLDIPAELVTQEINEAKVTKDAQP